MFWQDIAKSINASKSDHATIEQIEEMGKSLIDYRGVLLLQGRHILDGELHIRMDTDESERPV